MLYYRYTDGITSLVARHTRNKMVMSGMFYQNDSTVFSQLEDIWLYWKPQTSPIKVRKTSAAISSLSSSSRALRKHKSATHRLGFTWVKFIVAIS